MGREQYRDLLRSLPPEGIGVHGTNKSRAMAILETGFEGTVWYYRQPPTDEAGIYYLKHLREAIADVLHYAHRASNFEHYKLTGGTDDSKGALVIFLPLKEAYRNTPPDLASESRKIPIENVLGTIDVNPKNIYPNHYLTDDQAILRLLNTTLKQVGRFVRSSLIDS